MKTELFDADYERLFAELVQHHVREARKPRRPDRKWCAFWPAVGERYQVGGLMVIGRALNGWGSTDFTVGEVEHGCQDIIKRCRGVFVDGGSAVLKWADDAWGKGEKGKYRTSRSAFWRMVRRLACGADNVPDGWSHDLCWTNLMRISPACGWNPPWWSYHAQLPCAAELLAKEIQALKPAAVVAFTGKEWFGPFAQHLGETVALERASGCQLVEEHGTIGTSKIIIAPHPMRRNEDKLMNEINSLRSAVPPSQMI
jgi:hypothetical protein